MKLKTLLLILLLSHSLHSGVQSATLKDGKPSAEWEAITSEVKLNHNLSSDDWDYYEMGLTYEKGYRAKDKDKKKAIEWYRKSAKKGNILAQLRLANLVRFHSPNDEAVVWLRKAAEKNNISALNNMGYMYEEGHIGYRNSKEAFKYYIRAAELGSRVGQYNVCRVYHFGYGVSMDYKQAKRWCQKSIDQGYSIASHLLELVEGL